MKSSGSNEAELRQAVEQRIAQRTWGRVRHLTVEVSDGCVTVHGYSSTHYIKQLALLAVREVVALLPVQLEIQVIPAAMDAGQHESVACVMA